MLTYCLLLVFAPSWLLFLLVKPIKQVVFSISSIQHPKKIATLPTFFITRCQCGDCQSMWKEKENIFCQEVDVVKNKKLEDVTPEQLQAEARCIVQHPALVETGEGWLRLHFFGTKNHYTELPWFSFSSFYILLFSVHIVNVNTAKSGKGLDNLSVKSNTFRHGLNISL